MWLLLKILPLSLLEKHTQERTPPSFRGKPFHTAVKEGAELVVTRERKKVWHSCLCTFDESWDQALDLLFNLYTHLLMNSGKMQSAEYSRKGEALLIAVFYGFL